MSPAHRSVDVYRCRDCGEAHVGTRRVECGNCGNVHRADRWDDAYL